MLPGKAEDAALLTQGKDDNEAGRKKDKQDTVNTIAREYIITKPENFVNGLLRVQIKEIGKVEAKSDGKKAMIRYNNDVI